MNPKKQMSSRKKRMIIFLIAVLAVALVTGGLLLSTVIERALDRAPEGAGTAPSRRDLGETVAEEDTAGEEESNTILFDGKTYKYNDELSTLLVIGVDDYGVTEYDAYHNKSQSDFLLLAVFDPSTETCTLLQLNRDTITDIPALGQNGELLGYTKEQLALAHTYGTGLEDSCENTVEAVSHFLYGISIDNYFSLTMDAIPILNDLVGGVTVTIEDDFTGIDDTLVKGETVTLTAENVEHFVRSRMKMVDDATNTARMRRQRAFMSSLLDSLGEKTESNSGFALDAYNAVADYLVTDCSVNELSDYAERFSGYTVSDILTTQGETVMGEQYMEFYADELVLQEMIVDLFYTPVEQ